LQLDGLHYLGIAFYNKLTKEQQNFWR